MRSAFVAAGLFAAAAIAKPLELVKKSYTTTEPCASGPTGAPGYGGSGSPSYSGGSGAPSYGTPCMTKDQAQHVAQNFETLISYYTDEIALASLTVDFTDWSDSVNTLINQGCTSPAPVSFKFRSS